MCLGGYTILANSYSPCFRSFYCFFYISLSVFLLYIRLFLYILLSFFPLVTTLLITLLNYLNLYIPF